MASFDTSGAKIHPEWLEEGLDVRDRMIIELLVQVLDEQKVIERHTLRERLGNLIRLSDKHPDLKDTVQALINKL